MMLIIPSIDLKEGEVVRLSQGRPIDKKVYSHDPVGVAMMWEDKGVERLHVVDLDGALTGRPRNHEIIKEMVKRVKVPIQLGGGLRDMETIKEVLDWGVGWVVLGTATILDPRLLNEAVRKFGERIVVGVDAREGRVCVKGWVEKTSITPVELAMDMEREGVGCIIYTDILRDGMMEGPNLDGVSNILDKVKIRVIASGGISSIGDIRRLKALEERGLFGLIIGRALYEGRIDILEAIKIGRGDIDGGAKV